MSSCQEVFSAINIPTITTDYLILPQLYKGIEERNPSYWKFDLFGDCSYGFVFNGSSVVRLKEYKEIIIAEAIIAEARVNEKEKDYCCFT